MPLDYALLALQSLHIVVNLGLAAWLIPRRMPLLRAMGGLFAILAITGLGNRFGDLGMRAWDEASNAAYPLVLPAFALLGRSEPSDESQGWWPRLARQVLLILSIFVACGVVVLSLLDPCIQRCDINDETTYGPLYLIQSLPPLALAIGGWRLMENDDLPLVGVYAGFFVLTYVVGVASIPLGVVVHFGWPTRFISIIAYGLYLLAGVFALWVLARVAFTIWHEGFPRDVLLMTAFVAWAIASGMSLVGAIGPSLGRFQAYPYAFFLLVITSLVAISIVSALRSSPAAIEKNSNSETPALATTGEGPE